MTICPNGLRHRRSGTSWRAPVHPHDASRDACKAAAWQGEAAMWPRGASATVAHPGSTRTSGVGRRRSPWVDGEGVAGVVTRAGSRIACGSTGRRRRHGHPRARGGRRRGWRSGVAASDPAAPPTCGRRRRRRCCSCCSWLRTGRRRAEGAGPRRTTAEVGGTERRGGFLLLLAESRELCFASCMVCRREKGQRDGDWSCSC